MYAFVRAGFPRRPLALDRPPAPLGDKQQLTLSWIVPPWNIGSGGHTTIFRLVQMMEQRGHLCSVFVFDPVGAKRAPGGELREEIRTNFIPIEAPVFYGLDGWLGADVGIATQWWTAYPLRDLPGCHEKVYLVQDFEPAFYPYSAEYLWAEETYRMNYRAVAYTPWMARHPRRRLRHGVRVVRVRHRPRHLHVRATGRGSPPRLPSMPARRPRGAGSSSPWPRSRC